MTTNDGYLVVQSTSLRAELTRILAMPPGSREKALAAFNAAHRARVEEYARQHVRCMQR